MQGQHKINRPTISRIKPLDPNDAGDSPKHMEGVVFKLQPLVSKVPRYHGSFPDTSCTLKLCLVIESYATGVYFAGTKLELLESQMHPAEFGGGEAPETSVPLNFRACGLFCLSDTRQTLVNADLTWQSPVAEFHLPFCTLLHSSEHVRFCGAW